MKYYALNSFKLAIAGVLILAFIYSIPGLVYTTINTGISIGAWMQEHNY
jgi:hypothetical protein